MLIPGNHDLNRTALSSEKASHNELLASESENEFNDKLKDNKYIDKKFKPFIQFANKTLNSSYNFDIRGYSVNLNSEISVFALNSALTSTGGDSNFPADQDNLIIDTSILYEWINKSEGRQRILIMHHPLSFLKELHQRELEKIIQHNVDIVIYGHVHDENMHIEIHPTNSNSKETIFLRCPQLHSSKEDLNGYFILKTKRNGIDLVFRQWSKRRNSFQKGTEFIDNDEGVFSYVHKDDLIEDIIQKELEEDLNESLEIMGYTPSWEERILTKEWCNRNTNQTIIYYHDIINMQSNTLVVAPANYGLTCFGKYLRMRLWEIKKQHWLWIDLDDFKISQLDGKFGRLKSTRNITQDEIKGIVIDNWTFSNSSSQTLLDKLKNNHPNIRLIILGHSDQVSSIEGMDCDDRLEGFKVFYLNDLPRKSMRSIVTDFTKDHHIKTNETDESSIM